MKNPKSKIQTSKQYPNPKYKIQNFYPLTLTRSVEELRCGATTLADHPERQPEYIWDLIVNLKTDLEADLKRLGAGIKGQVHASAVIYNENAVLIEEGVEVEANAVLDARGGPIYIAQGTIIKPQSYLSGPLSIGPECRIGGEVTHSIFHGYSNKAHFGFIGHAYIGEWVNLGAGTTNSNLKNTYGTVKMKIAGKEIDSKQMFLGCIIGDHAKLGIGTLIPTGAIIGMAANVFGGGMIPKNIPSFSWGLKEKAELDKVLKTMSLVMARRHQELSPAAEKLIKDLYKSAS